MDQISENNRFPDGATVCFIGDSITCNNLFLAHIAAYYRARFPESGVAFYNCGIAGAGLKTLLAAFDTDVRPLCPTHCVLLIGANDSHLQSGCGEDHEAWYSMLERSFGRFRRQLSEYCGRIREIGAELILCTQLPYAEYQESTVPPHRAGAAVMLGYADFTRDYARENGYPLCDYHSYFARAMQKEVLFEADRVHPNPQGQYRIADCFLAFQHCRPGAPQALPEDVEAWHRTVRVLRDMVTAEHFILADRFDLPEEQRTAAMKRYLSADHSKEPDSALPVRLAEQYLTEQPGRQERIRSVTDFMRTAAAKSGRSAGISRTGHLGKTEHTES